MKKTTLTLAIGHLLWNIILVAPVNIKIMATSGGPWGFGIIIAFLTLPISIFSLVVFIYSMKNHKVLGDSRKGIVLNAIAFISIFLLTLLIMMPVESNLIQLIKTSWSWP